MDDGRLPRRFRFKYNRSVPRFGVRAVQMSLASALLVWTQPSRTLPSDPRVVINEVLVSNRFTNFDEDHDSSDWVEIYNPGTTTVNLTGYGLSDDIRDPSKWTFPSKVWKLYRDSVSTCSRRYSLAALVSHDDSGEPSGIGD